MMIFHTLVLTHYAANLRFLWKSICAISIEDSSIYAILSIILPLSLRWFQTVQASDVMLFFQTFVTPDPRNMTL